jgi:transposase
VQQLEDFKTAAQQGISETETAKKLGISHHTIHNWIARLRAGTLDQYMERVRVYEAKVAASPEKPQRGPGRPKKILHRPEIAERAATFQKSAHPLPEFLPRLLAYRAQGIKADDIGKKLGITQAQVYYWSAKARDSQASSGKSSRGAPSKMTPELIIKARLYREQGYTWREVGEKIGLHKATLYAHKDEILNAGSNLQKGEIHGLAAASNRNVFIGYAYAKVEEYIAVLAERAHFPHQVLRARLSELLGHSPLRQEPGHGD